MNDVRNELGLSGPISLGQTEVRNLAGVNSGSISLNDLKGKSAYIEKLHISFQVPKEEFALTPDFAVFMFFGFGIYKEETTMPEARAYGYHKNNTQINQYNDNTINLLSLYQTSKLVIFNNELISQANNLTNILYFKVKGKEKAFKQIESIHGYVKAEGKIIYQNFHCNIVDRTLYETWFVIYTTDNFSGNDNLPKLQDYTNKTIEVNLELKYKQQPENYFYVDQNNNNYANIYDLVNIYNGDLSDVVLEFDSSISSIEDLFHANKQLIKSPKKIIGNSITTVHDSFGGVLGTFALCDNLIYLSDTLFSECPNIKSFYGCFYNCENVTSNVPELWKTNPNADGGYCFRFCKKAANYNEIPEGWK